MLYEGPLSNEISPVYWLVIPDELVISNGLVIPDRCMTDRLVIPDRDSANSVSRKSAVSFYILKSSNWGQKEQHQNIKSVFVGQRPDTMKTTTKSAPVLYKYVTELSIFSLFNHE